MLFFTTKNLGRALPPSFGQNPKEQHFFFVKPSLPLSKSFTVVQAWWNRQLLAIKLREVGGGKKVLRRLSCISKYTEASPVLASAPHPHFSSPSVQDAVQKKTFFCRTSLNQMINIEDHGPFLAQKLNVRPNFAGNSY